MELEGNTVQIMGRVVKAPAFSHRLYGECFFCISVQVPRLSDCMDTLPVTLSERLLPAALKEGSVVEILGQVRSYNKWVNGANRLIITVFARQLHLVERMGASLNEVCLVGHLCKEPVYRITPFRREITDLLLAINRPYNKSDYIPCIAWGRNARFAGTLSVGDAIRLHGRLQSREYEKQMPDGRMMTRTAYEVSISGLEKIDRWHA